jgi:NAD(P)-dependent dehydrogenase (short-subunit alcohol dehydrogenase family)
MVKRVARQKAPTTPRGSISGAGAKTNLSGRRFVGKTVLVSGGAGGMGRAAALRFAAEGAKVGILDILDKEGREVERLIRDSGGSALFVKTDASKSKAVTAGIAKINKQFGPINVLFNHAGTVTVRPFHLTTEAEYDRLMDINVRSAFLVCRAVVAQMLESGGGSIVITSSNGGEMGFALESIYCMTKGAVLQLTRSLSTEYRNHNIRCNAICPGFVKTAHGLREIKELDGLGQKWSDADLKAAQVRICEPEEAAAAALFLASDDASFINGAALYVDNGWFAKG